MEVWTEQIRGILEKTPTRAMSFSSILSALKAEGALVAGREGWVLKRMAEQSDLYRIIPDRLGPWVFWPDNTTEGVQTTNWPTGKCDPWIVSASGTSIGTGPGERLVSRIRESLQAWGKGVDDGSQVSVARWIGAHGEAEKACCRLLTDRKG